MVKDRSKGEGEDADEGKGESKGESRGESKGEGKRKDEGELLREEGSCLVGVGPTHIYPSFRCQGSNRMMIAGRAIRQPV